MVLLLVLSAGASETTTLLAETGGADASSVSSNVILDPLPAATKVLVYDGRATLPVLLPAGTLAVDVVLLPDLSVVLLQGTCLLLLAEESVGFVAAIWALLVGTTAVLVFGVAMGTVVVRVAGETTVLIALPKALFFSATADTGLTGAGSFDAGTAVLCTVVADGRCWAGLLLALASALVGALCIDDLSSDFTVCGL